MLIFSDYVSNRRLLLSLADAGGRLMYSGKDLAELSGYTGRIYSLLSSLHALENDTYPEQDRSEQDNGEVRPKVYQPKLRSCRPFMI